ncbi:MAG: LuxR C-terminal-related transcriptional regulator [Serratia sp. (in: enterobacteria)]|uniref:LuxR C-terminal-related transcriptional regulator n=1 Tax=Serratia sp. (in: enterobacteria) TaxID=616 RepID=UPI003F2FCF39
MNTMLPIINLAIMEESPLARLGIEQFALSLHQGIRCQLQAASVHQLCQQVQDRPIDLLISGLAGSQESAVLGAEKLIKLCFSRPEIRQIIYTDSHCGELLHRLGRLTEVSLISRQETQEQTKACFMQALGGVRVCSPKIKSVIHDYAQGDLAVWQRLTAREREVLQLLFDGLSMSETANYLKRNIKTISAHKRNAMHKLGVNDDAEMFALRMHFSGAEKIVTTAIWR